MENLFARHIWGVSGPITCYYSTEQGLEIQLKVFSETGKSIQIFYGTVIVLLVLCRYSTAIWNRKKYVWSVEVVKESEGLNWQFQSGGKE